MRNKVQTGNVLEMIAAAAVVSGQFVKYGDIIGVAVTDAAQDEKYSLDVRGVFTGPKGSGAITVGQKLYWDDTNKVLSGTASGNTFAGHATKAALTGDTVVEIRLSI